jgi:hypothetical protein
MSSSAVVIPPTSSDVTDEQLRSIVFGEEPTPDVKLAEETPATPEPAKPVEESKPAAETTEPAKPEEPKQEDESEDKPKKGGINKRFSDMTREIRAEKERADRLQRELEALKQTSPPGPKQEPESEPQLDKFSDYDAYTRALARWQAKQIVTEELSARESAAKEATAKEERDIIHGEWEQRAARHLDSDPEFEDAIQAIGPLVTQRGVADVIKQSEVGPQMVSYLYQHQDEAVKILQAGSPLAIARELGKLEAKLSPATPPQAAAKPAAPALPKPPAVVSNHPAPVEVDLADCDMDAFRREMKRLGVVR